MIYGTGYITRAVTVSRPMQTGVFGGKSSGRGGWEAWREDADGGGGEGDPVRSMIWRSGNWGGDGCWRRGLGPAKRGR